MVYDGDGSRGSTNGTWVFVEDAQEVEDGMVFKAAQTLMRLRVIAQLD